MSNKIRIIFIGTPDFAVESLSRLVDVNKEVVAVITAPDRKSGRGQKISESAVKKYAVSKNIPVLQPTNLKSPEFVEELKGYCADLQIVVAFRMLPEIVWNMPKYGTFNLHASLLPDYRGAAPINWAIINGEKETGVTTFFLKHEIDTGDIIYQQKLPIEETETAGSLHDKLMETGGQLVLKTVEAIEEGKPPSTPQRSEGGKKAPKIFKTDCRIDWNKPAIEVDRLIRGMSPYPTAWTKLTHKESGKVLNLKIFEAEVKQSLINEAGILKVENKEVTVSCKTGSIVLKSLQVEGKKRMKIKELLNGFKLEEYKIS